MITLKDPIQVPLRSRGRRYKASSVEKPVLILGVDGGGTKSQARLYTLAGKVLGEGAAGPANVRFGVEESFSAIFDAARQCLSAGGFSGMERGRIVACLALAGVSEPCERSAAKKHPHPFLRVIITTDAHAACVGAHAGRDGGVIIAGTGAIGWAIIGGREYRCGGWGFPISDEGSGAWLGCEIIRRTLLAFDGRMAWSAVSHAVFEHFQSDPHAIVRWLNHAKPRDFAALAPLVVDHAEAGDRVAADLMLLAASHIDALAARLTALGAPKLALAGGLAPKLEPWLASTTRTRLVQPAGDAVDGAFRLARAEAEALSLING
jgi:glucosamine kinase